MTYWGTEPWQNSDAADWLDSFAKRTQLSERIEAAFEFSNERVDAVRAAAYLLLKFSQTGNWLLDEPERLFALAIDRLETAIEEGAWTSESYIEIVEQDLAKLRLAHRELDQEPYQSEELL